MKKKSLFWIIGFNLFFSAILFAQDALVPADALIKNVITHRQYLKRIKAVHTIQFLEGFFTSEPFVCQETITYIRHEALRVDYLCNDITLTFLQIGEERKLIYNKAIEDLEDQPFGFWPAFFMATKTETLIKSLAHFNFVTAQQIETEIEFPPTTDEQTTTKHLKQKETQWKIKGKVSIPVRLADIEKSTDEKMERNIALPLTSPNENEKIWFAPGLNLPLKLSVNQRQLVFSNYREIEREKRFYRYPGNIEIQEDGIAGIIINSDFEKFEINSKIENDFLSEKEILKASSKGFDEQLSFMKEKIEKFILEYR